MQKLLFSKKIFVQEIQDRYGDEIYFAYTQKLLERNILIEYYGVSSSDYDAVPEEVAVFIYCKEANAIHSYILLVSDQVLGTLPIYRVIADAVEFIEGCDVKNVLEDMKAIATSYELLTETFENPEFYKDAIYMYEKAMDLIQITRTPLN